MSTFSKRRDVNVSTQADSGEVQHRDQVRNTSRDETFEQRSANSPVPSFRIDRDNVHT